MGSTFFAIIGKNMNKVIDENLKQPNIKKKKIGSKIIKSKKLFDRWRFFRLLSSIIACVAIFPASSDYEMGFSEERTATNCMIVEDSSVLYRHLAMWLSFSSILLLIPYRYYFLKWKRHMPKTFHELPSYKKLTLMQVFEMRKKPKFSQYIGDDTIPITILLLILPYPGLDLTFTVSQQILYQDVKVCYFVTEPLYALMFLRWIYLIFSLFNFGKYNNQVAQRYREKFGVPMTPAFSLKCYLNQDPLLMLLFFFLIPGILIFGSVMRIFDRPLMKPSMDFDYVGNAWWNSVITMMTVGFGDTYPTTILGRLVSASSAIYGGMVLSFTFVSMGSILQLSKNEKNAFNYILVSSAATGAIVSALSYKKSEQKNIEERYNAWERVKTHLRYFMDYKEIIGADKDEGEEAIDNLKERVLSLEDKVSSLKGTTDAIIHKLNRIYTR
ncbi:unnamed protein product [Blepharisma stoltei]|uniref:Potassium channel domain-containing protein n=1 Tax=Blepharisma stoltei TaxID=1481888 RepID=A0AAU9K8K3_9CILI|nr:unnamed protein product [Blepharisma stoltei]